MSEIPSAVSEGSLLVGTVRVRRFQTNDGRALLLVSDLVRAVPPPRIAAGEQGDPLAHIRNISPFSARFPRPRPRTVPVWPVRFRDDRGEERLGYDLKTVLEICNVAALVRRDLEPGHLSAEARHFVESCRRLLNAILRSGQSDDDQDLGDSPKYPATLTREVLEEVVGLSLYPVKTRQFPFTFFDNVLHIWGWNADDLRNDDWARQFAAVVDDLVYRRLSPEELQELREKSPPVRVAGPSPNPAG